MKRVLTAVVLIPVVLLVVFKAPLWVFAAVTAVFTLIAAWEYLGLAAKYCESVPRVFAMICLGLLSVCVVGSLETPSMRGEFGSVTPIGIFVILLLFPLALLIAQLRVADFREYLSGVALASFVVPYVAFPFASLVTIRAFESGWFFVLWFFAMVWSGDIFAYYVGKNFGKRLIAPRVSPKKTWEGTIASVVGSATVSWLLCANVSRIELWLRSTGVLTSESVFSATNLLYPPPLWVPLALAVVINVVAQFGDLVESAIKRGADVKDSGTILPGHGGVLDRVDALLLAAPVAMLLFLAVISYFTQR